MVKFLSDICNIHDAKFLSIKPTFIIQFIDYLIQMISFYDLVSICWRNGRSKLSYVKKKLFKYLHCIYCMILKMSHGEDETFTALISYHQSMLLKFLISSYIHPWGDYDGGKDILNKNLCIEY